MPKQTFFNLPEEKQEILIEAAKLEFSRVPLNEASIANIVKSADIPRGSFYQYFEDKEDAFYYLLEKQTKVHNSAFQQTLKENNGNIFTAFIETYEKMLLGFQDEQDRAFFKNAFLNMNYKMENKLVKGFKLNKDTIDKQFSILSKHINIDKLNIASDEEFIHVVQIIMAVTFQNLMNTFARKYTLEEALEKYKIEMNLLKRGLSKED